MAIGNVGKPAGKATCELGQTGQPADNVDTESQKRSHDTSRIAWAKLLAKIAEAFPIVCPACGGDIRLIAFIIDPVRAAGRSRLTSGRKPGKRSGAMDGPRRVKQSRRQCHPPEDRPPSGPSSSRPMTTVTSCRPHSTSFQ
jgi:hypothetical protein